MSGNVIHLPSLSSKVYIFCFLVGCYYIFLVQFQVCGPKFVVFYILSRTKSQTYEDVDGGF